MEKRKQSNFIGQIDAVRKVNQLSMNSKETGTPFPHLVILGPPNSGRFTFAKAVASRLDSPYRIVEGDSVREKKEILPYLTAIESGGALIIRNAESVGRKALQLLESALKTSSIKIELGEGADLRTLHLKIQPFSCIAISENIDRVSDAIKENAIPVYFSSYSRDEAIQIILHKAKRYELDICVGRNIEHALLQEVVESVNGSTKKAISILTKAIAINPRIITRENLELIGFAIPNNRFNSSEQREHQIKKMTGVEFEKYIADILKKKGYSVNLTKASGDHGIDIQVFKSGFMGVVQCKQWADTVGEPYLRDFFGSMIHCGAKFGFFVTTSSFTEQARSFAHGKNIQLIDGRQLANDVDWFL